MLKLDLKKPEDPEIKLPKKQESSKKTLTSALLTTPKLLTVWITTNCGKFLKRWGYPRNPYAGQEATVSTGHGTMTGSKLGKEYVKAIYCFPAYLTYMWSTSCEMLDWMKHKLESRSPGEISITSDMQITPLLWKKVKSN